MPQFNMVVYWDGSHKKTLKYFEAWFGLGLLVSPETLTLCFVVLAAPSWRPGRSSVNQF